MTASAVVRMNSNWTVTQQAAFAELLRRDYKTFVQYFWPIVEPKALVWNWHLDVICKHLEQAGRGEIPRLAIAIPPGCMKSSLVSVFWDAWRWLTEPGHKVLAASYDLALIIRDNVKCRRIVESPEYLQIQQLLEPLGYPLWKMAPDQNQKQYFENTANGFRQGVTVNGGATGKRGDDTIVDDPIKIKDLIHARPDRRVEILEDCWTWYTDVFDSRVNDQTRCIRVVIMQRVDEEDLIGKLSRLEEDPYHMLVLPMEYDPDIADPDDPRTTPGELLFPQRFPQNIVDKFKREMTPAQYAAQYRQQPIPATGGLIKQEWLTNSYTAPPKLVRLIMSVDCANKAKKLNDPTVAILLGQAANQDIYVLDVWRKRYEFADLQRHIQPHIDLHQPHLTIVEDAANGTALLSTLKAQGYRVLGTIPHDDKHVRMSNQTPWLHANKVWLPQQAHWLSDFVFELLKFPQGKHDDQVDALSQGLKYFTDHPLVRQGNYAFHGAEGTVVQTQDGPQAYQNPNTPPVVPRTEPNAQDQLDAMRAHLRSLGLRISG